MPGLPRKTPKKLSSRPCAGVAKPELACGFTAPGAVAGVWIVKDRRRSGDRRGLFYGAPNVR